MDGQKDGREDRDELPAGVVDRREADVIDFFPIVPDEPRRLSVAEIERFNRDGYLAPLPALSAPEAKASRDYFDHLMARIRALNDRRNAYAIMGFQNRCRGIWELAQHPLICDYVEDLLGPDFVCWSTHYFCKVPGDAKRVPWHQDATYWPVRPTKTVTVWLAIDDVTPDNAPMRFIAGSHRHGAIEWHRAKGDVALGQEIDAPQQYGGAVYDNVMRAGEISIHASTLVHGSEPNHSADRRCGLTFRYLPSDCGVLPKAERILADAVVCRGEPGHWVRTPRPAGDDVSLVHSHYQD